MKSTKTKSWLDLEFFQQSHWDNIRDMVLENCDGKFWAPLHTDLFQPFVSSPRSKTKVILLGDGIRSRPHLMDGLAYSTIGIMPTFEAEAIFQELRIDQNFKGRPSVCSLQTWARQGILMLNTSFTKTVGLRLGDEKNLFHYEFWDDLLMEILYEGTTMDDIVYVLIGNKARELAGSLSLQGQHRCIEIDEPRTIINASGNEDESFIGSRVFTRINNHLKSAKKATINWSLPGCNKY